MANEKVYEIVTDRILQALEKGVVPWHKPWTGGGLPASLKTKKEYRGINVFLLAFTPHKSRFFLTYKQAEALGGHVKKGEKGYPIIFWTFIDKDKEDSDKKKKIPLLRYYTVFNLEQCEGIPLPKEEQEETTKREHNPIKAAEAIIAGYDDCPTIGHNEQRAYYCPSLDTVNLPVPESFENAEAYYATAFHELSHSTGHEKRLDRKISGSFGSHAYGEEELIAEMSAAYLCALAGIDNSTIENSAAYIESWRKSIKENVKLVVSAAGKAQKSADYIIGKTFEEEED
jgi:antirestriction protein ArdC